jgi:hypothetical protein
VFYRLIGKFLFSLLLLLLLLLLLMMIVIMMTKDFVGARTNCRIADFIGFTLSFVITDAT